LNGYSGNKLASLQDYQFSQKAHKLSFRGPLYLPDVLRTIGGPWNPSADGVTAKVTTGPNLRLKRVGPESFPGWLLSPQALRSFTAVQDDNLEGFGKVVVRQVVLNKVLGITLAERWLFWVNLGVAIFK
jgi:hypothetical protein